jgi:hypothetical protein
MVKTTYIVLFILLLAAFVIPVYGEESRQVTNKIYLSPFYRESVTQNTNYSYNLILNPPDGMNGVNNAIITVDAWINPAVTVSLWVNGVSCKNPSYTISTTYAGAGRGVMNFDCSNVIKKAGSYIVTLRSTKNMGASTAWLEVTYKSDAQGDMTVSGTDYNIGEPGKVFVTVSEEGKAINDAACLVEVFYPDGSEFIDYTPMVFLEDGIYYHDFVVDNVTGVYPIEVLCTYRSIVLSKNVSSLAVVRGVNAGTIPNLEYINDNYYRQTETAGTSRSISTDYNFSLNDLNTSETPLFVLSVFLNARRLQGADTRDDDINMYVYNYLNGTWLYVGTPFNYSATYNNYTFVVNPNLVMDDFVSPEKKVTWRINDTIVSPTDTVDNDLFIDAFNLIVTTKIANETIETIAGGGELNVKDYIGSIDDMIQNATIELNATLYGIIAALGGNFTIIEDRFDAINTQLNVMNVTLNGIDTNISSQNLTLLNESITQVIIEQSNNPPFFDLGMVVIGVLMLMLLALIWVRSTAYFVVLGFAWVCGGAFIGLETNGFIGLCVGFMGLMFFVTAGIKR